ncbi:hypothetical protein KIN20_037235 [Parelaphostrongylus tenuis]|uniref:Uncharacterized protein n=1 Tax=Parelaphostrongylus tenuis TaxID=148309 RepID=A0AAD5RE37_PARTN|nr:hypothetical protein KIN20_021080 [Parelaphostrongylus tenuis]KAJ1374532.1 hypothetical protein KIN20_037235 [Parelaphostrongylus tenuis]
MKILTKMASLPGDHMVIFLVATISTALRCGVMPPGQASTRTFTVTGFTLPVGMVYSSSPDVRARVPGVAPGEGEARAFVQRLVMQTVFDVLENQARSALLPDAIISSILSQLTVNITYTPMMCQTVRNSPAERAIIGMPRTASS